VTLLEEKDLAVIRSILGRAAIFDAHHRLAYAALVAVFVAYVASGRLHIATHAIVTWNAFAICSLVLAWNTIVRADLNHIQRTAQSQDFGRTVIFVVVMAAVMSLLTVGLLLGPSKDIAAAHSRFHILQSAIAVATSWCLTHTVYTLHYAHLFYSATSRQPHSRNDRGLDFPGGPNPNYLDFAYFAFVIGMTCQASDVQVTSRSMRTLVLIHGVLSFGFNTLILALSVSVIAQMLQRPA
jgi:uncharacterized membrane protein